MSEDRHAWRNMTGEELRGQGSLGVLCWGCTTYCIRLFGYDAIQSA